MRTDIGGLCAIVVAALWPVRRPALAAAGSCEGLSSLALADATITLAQTVAPGGFTPPVAGAPGAAAAFAMLPAFCRVTAVLNPSPDSHIEMEVWLPTDHWNGKFQAVGNGGWAGVITYPALASALREGYATASTDTRHKGGDAAFGIGHPEKITDFAFRAVHEMTVKSKAILSDYYARTPRLSHWNGCSTGGRQGLMEAQKYPEDFDAIVAGAPANYQTHLHAWDLNVAVPSLLDPAAAVPPAKLAMLNRAVLAACDARDGVEDGLLNNPRGCQFDPATLVCQGANGDNCLTPPQLESVKRMTRPLCPYPQLVTYKGSGSTSDAASFVCTMP
jgi:feruloyl esterase